MTIRNPVEWGIDHMRMGAHALSSVRRTLRHDEYDALYEPRVRHVSMADLGTALKRGFADFGACRTDVVFIGLIYPIAGLVLAQLAIGQGMWPLIFPLMSGFALVGPFLAAGLYEMSRRRERGEEVRLADAFRVTSSPAFGAMFVLGLGLFALFGLWLLTAMSIHALTLGPDWPMSLRAFLSDVFTTTAGWTMIVLGIGAGALFAVAALCLSVVSFPLLLDRNCSVRTAVKTSWRVVQENPVTMFGWGFIVAMGLVLGAIPALLGLIVVMPVLGHATWHLYRRAVG